MFLPIVLSEYFLDLYNHVDEFKEDIQQFFNKFT